MTLPLPRAYAPMEARLVDELPAGADWQYEPKWDGFRCLAFRDGAKVDLMSKAGKPLDALLPRARRRCCAQLRAKRFVLDGEIVVPKDGELSFDELLLRIHPGGEPRREARAPRARRRSSSFDLLVDAKGKSLVDAPLAERRAALEAFVAAEVPDGRRACSSRPRRRRWPR